MTTAPVRVCRRCKARTQHVLCDKCQARADKIIKVGRIKYACEYDKKRESATKRGYDRNWHKVRNIKISANPLCERCEKNGIVKPAEMVHHIKPISKFPGLRLDERNLMSLCNPCHEIIEHRGFYKKLSSARSVGSGRSSGRASTL